MAGRRHGPARPRTRKRSTHARFGLFLAMLVVCLSASAALAAAVKVGEPPLPGVYKFSKGSSGPNQSQAGRLTVSKTAAGYAFGEFQMWLGQKEGCSLDGHLATVEGVFPLIKKVKYFPLGGGKAETSLSWRLPSKKVKVRVGGKVYPGILLAAFLTPPPGAPPNVEGHMTLTPQEGAVCGGYFLGTHRGKS